MQSTCRHSLALFCFVLVSGFGFAQSSSAAGDSTDPASGISQTEVARLRPVVLKDLTTLMARVDNDTPLAADVEVEFTRCQFTRVTLGSLGSAVVVEAQPGHGASNAAMLNIYVESHGTFRRILAGEGFGPEIIPGSKAVPDVIFGWASGVCHTTYYRYHYNGEKYVADACNQEINDANDDDRCAIKACEGKLPTFHHP